MKVPAQAVLVLLCVLACIERTSAQCEERWAGCSTLTTIDANCGVVSSFTSTELAYPANSTCSWLIRPTEKNFTSLFFREFKVEPFPFDCSQSTRDVVRVYDGSTTDSPLLASLCGFAVPPPVIATSAELLIVLVTDHNAQFKGFELEFNTSDCAGCTNGGECVGYNDCQCADGWGGDLCQFPVCVGPCQNGGSCDHPFNCTCTPGWEDPTCSTPICSQGDCVNGVCTGPDMCECEDGWEGSVCDTPICVEMCENGGECTAPGQCECEVGWEGPTCSVPICSNACQNGGVCVEPDTCVCSGGYFGSVCEDGSHVDAANTAKSYVGGMAGTGELAVGVLTPDNSSSYFTNFSCSEGVCGGMSDPPPSSVVEYKFRVVIIDSASLSSTFDVVMLRHNNTYYPSALASVGGALPFALGSASAISINDFCLARINALKGLQQREPVYWVDTVNVEMREEVDGEVEGAIIPVSRYYDVQLVVDEVEPYNSKLMGLNELFVMKVKKAWSDGLYHLVSVEERDPWMYKLASGTLPTPLVAYLDSEF